MLKANSAFIAIMAQTIICMCVNYYLGMGYSLILFVGFVTADAVFVIVLFNVNNNQ